MNSTVKSDLSSAGGWGIFMGVLIVIAGMLAAATPIITFISAMLFVAAMIFVAGVFALVHAFQDQGAARKILDVILGVLSIIAAIMMFQSPGIATVSLALWVAIWLIVRGIAELIWAFRTPVGRALIILNGAVDLFLGVILLRLDTVAAVATLGFYVAISLIFWGVRVIVQGAAVRDVSRAL